MKGWFKSGEANSFFKGVPKLIEAINKLTAAVEAQNAMTRRAGAGAKAEAPAVEAKIVNKEEGE